MTASHKPKPQAEQVAAWLAEQHDGAVSKLAPLKGGFWSSAFSYSVGNSDYVLRLSEIAEGFAIDKAAMRFASALIPVPEVVAIGEALGLHYAISRRHYGRFLETITIDEAPAAGTALATLLQAMRAAKPLPNESVVWYEPQNPLTWRDWLKGGLGDNAESPVGSDPRLDRIFKTSVARIDELLPACPERRDLIHGDLLHQNVLVNEDAQEITAVFSWKCSARGDFLYDVAWCTFWGNWFPAIAQLDLWQRTLNAPDLNKDDLKDASLRHHCYELQIAASHFGWFVWTGEDEQLAKLADVVEQVLERGPLAA
ncbi:MAG: aminoglycoside phosphotransferase family protein [Chloroflexota bacterium]